MIMQISIQHAIKIANFLLTLSTNLSAVQSQNAVSAPFTSDTRSYCIFYGCFW